MMLRAMLLPLLLTACVSSSRGALLEGFAHSGAFGEQTRVLTLEPGVTATIVAPAQLDRTRRIDLILYALPNGNTTAQTMGRKLADGMDWHFDIQHIAAQTRVLRTRGMDQAVIAYLEADSRSWPAWRQKLGYDVANPRIVAIVDQVRGALGNAPNLSVTLSGHSGGGSFAWGFLDGQERLPNWLERIAFLDANYSFEPRHGDKIAEWLRRRPENTLVVLAYDDREIMLDGKKVVSDSGGTWRASHRMMDQFARSAPFTADTLGEFLRYHTAQMEFLLHPNPQNRILHTEMIGEMNGYMHAMLVRRPSYRESVLKTARMYTPFVEP
jgi:hypothetical protein